MISPRGTVIFRRTQFRKKLGGTRDRYISQVDSCNSRQIDTNDRHLGGTQSDKNAQGQDVMIASVRNEKSFIAFGVPHQ